MGCNLCTGILRPICISQVTYTPPTIECPGITNTFVFSPLCYLLPTIKSITDFFINLPVLLLFVVSMPARFLYCMAYTFLANADQFYELLTFYLLYPFIDFVTAPFIYFALGFTDGFHQHFTLPNQLYGFLNACFISSILKEIYEIFGEVFYVLGYAIGFFSSFFITLYNFIIDSFCLVAYLTIELGLSYCINLGITQISNCYTISFQPFGFLQGLVCKFLNCQCALGQCPTLSLVLPLSINCQAPQCGSESVIPKCMYYNLLGKMPENSENSSETSSEPSTSENSENNVFGQLPYCYECIGNKQNCNLCFDAIDTIKTKHITFPCCSEPCLINYACHECNLNNNPDACSVCDVLTNACYITGNISNLPCYNSYVSECGLCYSTLQEDACNLCKAFITLCKEEKSSEVCQELTSESETSETTPS